MLPFDFATLTTERLTLRPVREADLPALLAVNGDDEVTRYLPYGSWQGMDDARAWFDRTQGRLTAGEAAQWVIETKATGEVIGGVLLFQFDRPSQRAELGYLLGRAWWGAGYMQEALRATVDFAFGPAGLRRLNAWIDPRNDASARVLGRLGFEREGFLREYGVYKGELSDSAMYGLLRNRRTDRGTPGAAGADPGLRA